MHVAKLLAPKLAVRRSSQLEITYRGLTRSDALEAEIAAHIQRLAAVMPDFVSCRVLIQAPSPHHCHGEPFHVRLELAVATGHLVVGREPGSGAAHVDVRAALHDAFRCARRQLKGDPPPPARGAAAIRTSRASGARPRVTSARYGLIIHLVNAT